MTYSYMDWCDVTNHCGGCQKVYIIIPCSRTYISYKAFGIDKMLYIRKQLLFAKFICEQFRYHGVAGELEHRLKFYTFV